MKLFSGFLLGLMLFATMLTFGQTTKQYDIKWNAAVSADSVKYWEVYMEKRTVNSGFTIVDGMEYAATLETFKLANVTNTGQTAPSYTFTVSTDGGWMVAGIIANNDIRSQVGASTSTKNAKKPGKPTGVTITPK